MDKCWDEKAILLTDLQNDLFIKCKTYFTDKFQSEYAQTLSPNSNSCPRDLELQGSCADGFVIFGRNSQSDIDFIYSMNGLMTPPLYFNNLSSNPEAPAHMKIEVIPDFSVCNTEMEKEKFKKYIQLKNTNYFLNIKSIKKSIREHVKKGLINSSNDPQVVIEGEETNCFRIEFIYSMLPIMINHLQDLSFYMHNFLDNIVEMTKIKQEIEILLQRISRQYYVSKPEWQLFHQELLKTSQDQNVKFPTNPNIDFLVVTYIEKMIKNIEGLLRPSTICDKFHHSIKVSEQSIYLLLCLLITCGFFNICPVVLNKNRYYSGLCVEVNENVNFSQEEISKILDIDISEIFDIPVSWQQIKLEKNFCSAVNSILYKTETLLNNFNKQYKISKCLSLYQDLSEGGMDNIIGEKYSHKAAWVTSMITKMIILLENTINIIDYYKNIEDIDFHQISQKVEVVPGLRFSGWPLIASDWTSRERYWPSTVIIQRVINNGFHVVFKSSKSNSEYDARLSFSEAERIICEAMTPEQMNILIFLKELFKKIKTESLKSYYIKSLCFTCFERLPTSPENSKDLQIKYLDLIMKYLLKALQDRKLPHYFIPNHNLFIDLRDEDYGEIYKGLEALVLTNNFTLYSDHRIITGGKKPILKEYEYSFHLFFHFLEHYFYKSINQYFVNF